MSHPGPESNRPGERYSPQRWQPADQQASYPQQYEPGKWEPGPAQSDNPQPRPSASYYQELAPEIGRRPMPAPLPHRSTPMPGAARSSIPGMVAFLAAIAAPVIMMVVWMPVTGAVAAAVRIRSAGGQKADTTALIEQAAYQNPGVGLGTYLVFFLGLAALIIGIVATARKSGRGWGIGAIILAILGPLIGFVGVIVITLAQV